MSAESFLEKHRRVSTARLRDAESFAGVDGTATFPELSVTRRAVALLIASGHGDSRVDRAARLQMTVRVYDTHRLGLMRKLGVRTDVQLCLLMISRVQKNIASHVTTDVVSRLVADHKV